MRSSITALSIAIASASQSGGRFGGALVIGLGHGVGCTSPSSLAAARAVLTKSAWVLSRGTC